MKFMQTHRINPAFESWRVLPNTADVICGCSLMSNRRGSERTCETDPSPCTSTMGRKEGGMIKVARHSGHAHTIVSAERGRDADSGVVGTLHSGLTTRKQALSLKTAIIKMQHIITAPGSAVLGPPFLWSKVGQHPPFGIRSKCIP